MPWLAYDEFAASVIINRWTPIILTDRNGFGFTEDIPMRRLISTLVFLGLIIGLIGYYRGWFVVSVDQTKLQQDEQAVKEKLQQGSGRLQEDINKGIDKARPTTVK